MLTAAGHDGTTPHPRAPYHWATLVSAPLVLWWAYCSTNPFYVFGSGSVQPADAFLVLLFGFVLARCVRGLPSGDGVYLTGALFLIYVACVNLSWLTVYPSEAERLWPPPKPMMIWATVFYLYNFLVMFAVMVIANEDYGKLVTVTKVGLGCALAIELGAVALHGPGGFRGTGTFNNPNQLGYWALLVTGVWLVMKGTDRLNRVDAGALGAALYLVVLSLSKAAMFSTLLLIVTAVALQRTSTRLTAVVGVVVVTLITVVAVFPDRTSRAIAEMTSEGLVARLEHRLGNLGGENDDSLAGRGYDRLWENPQYLVFGAGEGAIWRFATSGRAMRMEIHSTFGALAFNYGIVGLSLFFALMTAVFRGALFRHVLYAGPLFLYGLTHQGLRDTLLWIFFGLVVASTHERRAGKRIAMSQTGNVAYRGAL